MIWIGDISDAKRDIDVAIIEYLHELHMGFHLAPRLMTLNDLDWLFEVT